MTTRFERLQLSTGRSVGLVAGLTAPLMIPFLAMVPNESASPNTRAATSWVPSP